MSVYKRKLQQQVIGPENGMSLIEMVVTIGIGSIVALSFASLASNMHSETKYLGEKLAVYEIKSRLQGALINDDFCSCLFRSSNSTLRTFDTNQLVFNPPLSANQIPIGYAQPIPTSVGTPCVASGGTLVPAPNGIVPGFQFRVGGLNVTGVQDRGGGKYAANIEISFANLSRPMRDIRVPVNFAVDLTTGSPNGRPFASCSFPPSPGFKLIAHNVPAGSQVSVPANTCQSAIRVEMSMNAFRNDTSPGGYIGRRFEIQKNGATHPQLTLEFGSAKGGSRGHGWAYRANGLSKVYYTTDVGISNSFTSGLYGDGNIAITDALYTVSCAD